MAGKVFKVTQVPKKETLYVGQFDDVLGSFNTLKELEDWFTAYLNTTHDAHKEEVDYSNTDNSDNAVTERYELKVTLRKKK